jgi:biopolymer transport protein ExbB
VPGAFSHALLVPLAAIRDLIEAGGPFVVWIFLCCVLLWSLVLERWFYYTLVLPREATEALTAWRARTDRSSWCAHQIRRATISRFRAGMNANMRLMRVLVPLSPLLGLIGTVSGMLEVFDSMALRGSADARTMANGVSEAMICTLTGLTVSITGLYPVHYFDARARRQTELLADSFEF